MTAAALQPSRVLVVFLRSYDSTNVCPPKKCTDTCGVIRRAAMSLSLFVCLLFVFGVSYSSGDDEGEACSGIMSPLL